jgi:predicted transcriptional regulator of viral defense system
MKRKYLLTRTISQKLKKTNIGAFSVKDFANIFGVSVRKGSLYLIRNSDENGPFKRLIRGYYFHVDSPPSIFEISNIIVRPSYISLDTALSFYKIIPEVVYATTALTPRHARMLTALNQEFKYQHVSKKLYFGYQTHTVGAKKFLIATKEKALLDYLYYLVKGGNKINDRIRLNDIDWDIVAGYLKLFNRGVKNKYIMKKMSLMIESLVKYA